MGGLRLIAEGTTGRRNRIDSVLVRRAEPPAQHDEPDTETETEERLTADA
jgi:hypothetical protein